MKKFTRLNITAEGQTEERFVKQTLSIHLGEYNISTAVRCVLTSKDKNKFHRGGLVNYQKAKNDIFNWLKEDRHPEARFTSMFDLYALPNDFPGFETSEKIANPYKKVEFLEEAFANDINDKRFIPYIQLHEFEALLFSKPEALKVEYFEHFTAIERLKKIVAETGNPELINDNPDTAPSKRIINLIPEYAKNKASAGATVAGIIGIELLKRGCKHFNDWVIKLENL